jgi:DNA-binding response OmpR family regulator
MTATQLSTGEPQTSPVAPLSPSAHASAVEDARVLIADDDPSARLLMVGLLERAGFWRVDAAAGGRMALAAMRRRPPAVLLLDVHMPDFDGLAMLRALSTDIPSRSVTSVLAVSGDASSEVRRSMLFYGADDFLVRPCSGIELVDHVRSLVRRTRAMNQALRQVSLLDGLVRHMSDHELSNHASTEGTSC